MTVNGETTSLPEVDPDVAAAALAVYAHRHEVVHLLYAATDEPDALTRIAALLSVDETTVGRVLDQPLRWMLPQFRTELDIIAAASAPTWTASSADQADHGEEPADVPTGSSPPSGQNAN